MSGHSKWSTIKRKKGAADAKRGKLFTKHARLITIAARESGGDPEKNVSLRFAIDQARKINMPNQTIERARKKGAGELEGEALQEVVYEGYGPEQVAFFVQALTDNTNRTLTDVRQAFSSNGGTLGETGSVAWQFSRVGYLLLPASEVTDEQELAFIDAGAQDIERRDETACVVFSPEDLSIFQELATTHALSVQESSIRMQASETVSVSEDVRERVQRLIDALEELDDVTSVQTSLSV